VKVVLATVCPARILIDLAWASTTGAEKCSNGCYTPFQDRHPAYYDRSHESYSSAIEFDRKVRTYLQCATAMMMIPPGEIMLLLHIADLSDKAPTTKGIEAWKYYRYSSY
jgi:hypothetical protein